MKDRYMLQHKEPKNERIERSLSRKIRQVCRARGRLVADSLSQGREQQGVWL